MFPVVIAMAREQKETAEPKPVRPVTAVVQSFLASGEGGYKVGGLGLIGLILALGALLCGIFAVKEPKIRPLLPRLGIVFGAVLTVGLGGMYIFGLVG